MSIFYYTTILKIQLRLKNRQKLYSPVFYRSKCPIYLSEKKIIPTSHSIPPPLATHSHGRICLWPRGIVRCTVLDCNLEPALANHMKAGLIQMGLLPIILYMSSG